MYFVGQVEDGKLLMRNAAAFRSSLQKFNGKSVEVIVKELGKTKSEAQHRYYFGCIINIISRETGNDPLEVHEVCKMMFLPREHKSTMTLSTKEAEEYYNKIRLYFAENYQITIPLPNEYV